MQLILLIVIGALAFRGACTLNYYANDVLYTPKWATRKGGKRITQIYTFAAIPIAMLNGFLLHGASGLLITGICTWLGMLIVNIFLRFSAQGQFLIFGSINIIWTLSNIISYS